MHSLASLCVALYTCDGCAYRLHSRVAAATLRPSVFLLFHSESGSDQTIKIIRYTVSEGFDTIR